VIAFEELKTIVTPAAAASRLLTTVVLRAFVPELGARTGQTSTQTDGQDA